MESGKLFDRADQRRVAAAQKIIERRIDVLRIDEMKFDAMRRRTSLVIREINLLDRESHPRAPTAGEHTNAKFERASRGVTRVTLLVPFGLNVEGRFTLLVEPGPDRRRAVPGNEVDSETLRLLIVEDEPAYRAYIAALTRRVGFRVETAGDGAAALEILEQKHFDVAIIDQNMPRMTGVELIARIRGDRNLKSLYAMMLTASEDVDTKLSALNSGFDDFVTKASSELEIAAKLVAARRIAARQRTLDTTIRELYGLATRDELTGVFNRRFLLSEGERLLKNEAVLNLILFDLDGFKTINDTFGHLAGDRVLHDVGALFDRHTRPQDLIARYGGDEFVMVISDLPHSDVERVAQRLCAAVHKLRWIAGAESFSITVTTGVASSGALQKPTMTQLLSAADSDLYRNKSLRNHPDGSPVGYVQNPLTLLESDFDLQGDDWLWRTDSSQPTE